MIMLQSKMKTKNFLLLPTLAFLSQSKNCFGAGNTCNHSISHKLKLIPDVNNELHRNDIKLHQFLRDSIPEALAHTGAETFDDHLKGVQGVLRRWEAPEYLCNAGLFHSIYGTEGFQGYKLPLTHRPAIRSLIGMKAERLVWIFCMVDRLTVDNTVVAYMNKNLHDQPKAHDEGIASLNTGDNSNNNSLKFQYFSRDELGRFPIHLDKNDWLDFLELTLADWLEQVEGAADKENSLFQWKRGEAWSYRRLAYKQMAAILSTERQKNVYLDMHNEIYKQESEGSRSLIQSRTPPMSAAAREAREAIESITL